MLQSSPLCYWLTVLTLHGYQWSIGHSPQEADEQISIDYYANDELTSETGWYRYTLNYLTWWEIGALSIKRHWPWILFSTKIQPHPPHHCMFATSWVVPCTYDSMKHPWTNKWDLFATIRTYRLPFRLQLPKMLVTLNFWRAACFPYIGSSGTSGLLSFGVPCTTKEVMYSCKVAASVTFPISSHAHDSFPFMNVGPRSSVWSPRELLYW